MAYRRPIEVFEGFVMPTTTAAVPDIPSTGVNRRQGLGESGPLVLYSDITIVFFLDDS